MRITTLLATAALAIAVVVLGDLVLRQGVEIALGESAPAAVTAVPAVPGPQRPVGELPPAPPEVAPPPDRKRPPPAATAPEPPRTATVAAPPTAPPAVLEGAFRPGATGEKAAGRALARPLAGELKLEKLAVTAGRDLEVWLVAVDRLGDGADFTDTKHVSLGKLKKNEGDQSYRLPLEIDLSVYRAVVVWSRHERSARAGAILVPQVQQKPTRTKTTRNR
mgnify:CR=1 FL=1